MRISQAEATDVRDLARLLWLDTLDEQAAQPSLDEFAADLAQWWAVRRDAYRAFVARPAQPEVAGQPGIAGQSGIVGMAWLALVPRVPRPGATRRMSADVQSVFVLPDHRGRGIGSALVDAAAEHARRLGASRVTVQSGRRAVPMYERLGFAPSRQLMRRLLG